MNHYALLFRSTRALTPEELRQRALEIASWVKQVSKTGIILDPRNLGAVAVNFSAEGSEILFGLNSSDPALRTMVFFDAPTKEQAVNIAKMHPSLRYGVTVEVREWTSPREAASKR